MRELDFDWMRRILVGLRCRLDLFALQVSVFHIRVCLEDGQLVYSEVFLMVHDSVTARLKRRINFEVIRYSWRSKPIRWGLCYSQSERRKHFLVSLPIQCVGGSKFCLFTIHTLGSLLLLLISIASIVQAVGIRTFLCSIRWSRIHITEFSLWNDSIFDSIVIWFLIFILDF